MSEIIQSYTGTLDNLNMSGIVFSLNMSGAQSTLADNKFALKSITFAKPSSAGYQDPVYLNLWEMKEGESTYTYTTSSTNASNTTTSSDGVWNFTGVELDIDSKYYLTVTASPSSVMSDLILVRSRVYSVPSGSGVGSHNYINNYNPPSLQFNWMPVMSLTLDETIEGSINISKGYYDSGSAKIIMPASTVSLTDLKSGETVGCKNKLFAYSKNNVVGVKITGDRLADISTAHDVSVDLNKPIYLDHTKEYIAGGAEIAPVLSFSNGGTTSNFVATGSLTFGADGEVSGFSSGNTLKLDRIFTATSTQSFEISFKIKTGSYTGSIQEIFAMSPPLLLRTSSGYWNLPYNTGSWNDSNKDSLSASTVYYVKVLYYPTTTTVGGVTYTGKYLYFEVYDSSKTLLHRYNYSLTGNFLNFQNAEAYLGSQSGGENWGGSIYLDENAYIKIDGELFWEPYTAIAPGITTQKALVYDNVSDKTFWYPSATSLALSNFTTPADRSNIYYLNLFNVAAQLHAGESAPGSGDYMQSSDYVYLNHAHDKILGVQEEPDEIVLEGGSWTQPVLSSNGTWGGTEFAVSASSVLSSNSEAWKAFDGIPDTNSNDRWHSSSGHPAWIGWYNPEPLIITNIQVQNRAVDGSFINSYDVSYSDDGSTWTVCTSGTSPDQTNGAYWNIAISETTGHKYWRLISNSSSGSNSDYTAVGLITLTAYTNTVKVSDSHSWTYLKNSTYDCEGKSLAVSSMSGSALSGSLLVMQSGTLVYTEDNSQGILGDAFTGYTVTFTDTSHSAIASLTKTGTRCRCYSAYNGNVENPHYYSFYVTSLPVTGEIPMSMTSLVGNRKITPSSSTSSYTYNATTDTITYSGFTASYIGDVYVNLGV